VSRYFDPAYVSNRFALPLADRYRRFLTDERPGLGRRFAILPSYQGAMPVCFEGRALESFFHDGGAGPAHPSASEAELGGAGGWVPLATIGDDEAQFLAVRAGEPACPVAMWEHETGEFVRCAATLDAFLAGLATTARAARPLKSPVKLSKVRAVTDELQGLAKAAPSPARTAGLEAGLAALEPMLAAMPPTWTMTPDDATVPGLAHYARGVALRALGRPEEALAALERAPIDGVAKNVAPQVVVELLLIELDRPARVIEQCEAHPDPLPLMRRSWALALLRLGRLDEAAAQLAVVIERQVAATLRLKPTADPAAERARRAADLAQAVSAYAERHQLDARAWLACLP
jgi:tetratricopeptide (TPR) repeat protein